MRRLFAIACLVFLCGAVVQKKDGTYVSDITVAGLWKIYKPYDYKDYLYVRDWHYPPVFLQKMPSDYDKISDIDERNRLFLMILAPLAMKVNKDILKEREEFLKLRDAFKEKGALDTKQSKRLDEIAQKYDSFTHLKDDPRLEYLFTELEKKINELPPSVLIGVAILETDWGTSKALKKGNSLYKELVWHTDEGLRPEGETEDNSYRIRIFPSLYDSMYSYALKLNSGINYEQTRFLRSELKRRGRVVLGTELIHSMVFDSNLPNFAGLLDYTVNFYQLDIFDESKLAAPKNVTKN